MNLLVSLTMEENCTQLEEDSSIGTVTSFQFLAFSKSTQYMAIHGHRSTSSWRMDPEMSCVLAGDIRCERPSCQPVGDRGCVSSPRASGKHRVIYMKLTHHDRSHTAHMNSTVHSKNLLRLSTHVSHPFLPIFYQSRNKIHMFLLLLLLEKSSQNPC